MPNSKIEIWGLDWEDALDESVKIKKAINYSLFKNVAIIIVKSHCFDLFTGESRPFLRICDTDRKRAEKLIKFLEEFDFYDKYDIEILELRRFYSKD